MALTRLKRRRAKGFRAQATKRAKARLKALQAPMRRLKATRIRIDRSGYAPNGNYFGTGGKPVYYVLSKEEDYPDGEKYGYVRANSAEEAKREAVERPGHWGIKTYYPSGRYYAGG